MRNKLTRADVNARFSMYKEAWEYLERRAAGSHSYDDKYERAQAKLVAKELRNAGKRFLKRMEATAVGRKRT